MNELTLAKLKEREAYLWKQLEEAHAATDRARHEWCVVYNQLEATGQNIESLATEEIITETVREMQREA